MISRFLWQGDDAPAVICIVVINIIFYHGYFLTGSQIPVFYFECRGRKKKLENILLTQSKNKEEVQSNSPLLKSLDNYQKVKK